MDATLDDLALMRRAGVNIVRRIDRRSLGEMSPAEEKGMERVGDDCAAFERVARAVRQIIALEHETAGIRPMPQPRGGSADDGGGGSGLNAHSGGRESLRTGSTRGVRNDLKDPVEPEWTEEDQQAYVARMERVIAAAEADIAAAAKTEEAKKASPFTRITSMIYSVPRPNFEACLDAMSREISDATTGALVRKWAKPGSYTPPYKPP
jgi:hypothetical protein